MSAWDADADELIAAGWGSHSRSAIPDDWRTRRGPDQDFCKAAKERGNRPKRLTWRERRAIFEEASKREAVGD